jgi:hypothetical protein
MKPVVGIMAQGMMGVATAERRHVSGEGAARAEVLGEYGMKIGVLDGPVGAASALKMSHAGITQGPIAMGSSREHEIYSAIAQLYQRLGADFDGDKREIEVLRAFFPKA